MKLQHILVIFVIFINSGESSTLIQKISNFLPSFLDYVGAQATSALPPSMRTLMVNIDIPLWKDMLATKFCDNGEELTYCPNPNCPPQTCDNTFMGSCQCSDDYSYGNCSFLTCRCPKNQVYDKDLKCVNIEECVKCKVNEIAVCPDYKCAPRTCVNRLRKSACIWNKQDISKCQKKLQCACDIGYFYDSVLEKCVKQEDCTRYWWTKTYAQQAVSTLGDVAVKTGDDQHNSGVWIMKGELTGPNGNITLPGKLTVKNRVGLAAYGGEEILFCELSVLCAIPGVLEWVRFKTGDMIPNNAIVGGINGDKIQYIGKAPWKSYSTPGRVEDGVLYLPYYSERQYEKFEILCEKK